MNATVEDLQNWIYESPKESSHVAVVCDTYNDSAYPVYIDKKQNVFKEVQKYIDGENMTQLVEVYDLAKDIEEQLKRTKL